MTGTVDLTGTIPIFKGSTHSLDVAARIQDEICGVYSYKLLVPSILAKWTSELNERPARMGKLSTFVEPTVCTVFFLPRLSTRSPRDKRNMCSSDQYFRTKTKLIQKSHRFAERFGSSAFARAFGRCDALRQVANVLFECCGVMGYMRYGYRDPGYEGCPRIV